MSLELGTRVLKASAEATADAARTLAAGGLVAFPTETVYGLGADATRGEAVARLYAAKERPAFNPLIAHVPDLDAARRIGVFNAAAEKLASKFWPGPLTLVLPKADVCAVADLATAGLDTVAVRMPAHEVAREILRSFGKPIVAPSANRSGHVSPTSAAHVLADLRGRVELIVDDGATTVGVESTIVACVGDQSVMLRPGGLAREDIEQVLGAALLAVTPKDEAPLAPGMLPSHYAPRAKLRLDASGTRSGEALLAFGALPEGAPKLTLNLSERGNLEEAAANLFSHLRALDATADAIAVMAVPRHGLGEAINDRLARAAAPKPRAP